MSPSVPTLIKGVITIYQNVMKCAILSSAKFASGRLNVTPKFEHIGGADRVNLGVEDKGNHTGTGTINQICPREIERDDILPVRPNPLAAQTRCMTEVILFLDGSKSCSCLLTSLTKRWVSKNPFENLNLDDQFVLQTANYDRQAALILLTPLVQPTEQ